MTLPISIVIPCYGQEEYLQLAIASVKEQADDITVVNDESGGGQWGYNGGNVRAVAVGREVLVLRVKDGRRSPVDGCN